MRRGNVTAGVIGGALGAIGTLSAVALANKKLRENFIHRFEDIRTQGEKLLDKLNPQVKKEINGRRRAALKSVRRLRKRAE